MKAYMGSSRTTYEEYIKTELKATVWEAVDWTDLAPDRA
jgi:hypothetical protein